MEHEPRPIWATAEGRILLKLYAAYAGALIMVALAVKLFVIG